MFFAYYKTELFFLLKFLKKKSFLKLPPMIDLLLDSTGR